MTWRHCLRTHRVCLNNGGFAIWASLGMYRTAFLTLYFFTEYLVMTLHKTFMLFLQCLIFLCCCLQLTEHRKSPSAQLIVNKYSTDCKIIKYVSIYPLKFCRPVQQFSQQEYYFRVQHCLPFVILACELKFSTTMVSGWLLPRGISQERCNVAGP